MTEAAQRERALDLIWKTTHQDFKGMWQGHRSIMVNRKGVTQIVLLTDLTDDEIAGRIPKSRTPSA